MELQIQNISKTFEKVRVLNDLSFSIKSGTITSLFGENGTGKTTLFHIISGFLVPDSGRVIFNGKDITGNSAVEIARQGIGRIWQRPRIFKNISVMDNLLLATRNHPGESLRNYIFRLKTIFKEERLVKERAVTIANEVNMAGKLEKTAGSLSLGQQKLLSTGMLLMSDTEFLLLDEPFAGVSSQMVEHISKVLLALKNRDKTIFLIEHNLTKAQAISDRTITLVKGQAIENDF